MASVDIYDQGFVYLDGTLLGEATNIETTLEGNDQDVLTLYKGWAGITPSPKKRTTKIDSMILSAGLEFDVESAFLTSKPVELMIQFGGSGKSTKSMGFLRNVVINSGVGENSKLSFEHHGKPGVFT